MCQRGRTGAHNWAQRIRRQVGAPSVQFSPVLLCNFTPVLTIGTEASLILPQSSMCRLTKLISCSFSLLCNCSPALCGGTAKRVGHIGEQV